MEKEETARPRRSQRDYTHAFKLAVVREVEQGVLTYKQAQYRYGIQGKSTVLVWLRKYGTLDWSPTQLRQMNNKEKTPEQRIRELEAELARERQKTLFLETMIDIVEKQYGLPVRKKPSPKQQNDSDGKDA